MNAKEKWISDTLNSIDTIQKAEVPSKLKENLFSRVATGTRIIYIRPFVKWTAAAIILLIMGLNFISIMRYKNTTSITQNQVNPIYKEYFSFLNNL